ncbi:MAG: hypothetical protein Q8P79_00370 [Nanoarchaeota archaeon]|nr:hypothetical protein [Nanoarchaeota archaeon]
MFSLEELLAFARNVRGWELVKDCEGIMLGSAMFWEKIKIQNVFTGDVQGINVKVGHYETIDSGPFASDTYKIEIRAGEILLGKKEAKNGTLKSLYEGVRNRYEKKRLAQKRIYTENTEELRDGF